MAFGGLAIVLGLTFSWIAPQTSRITVAAVQDVKGANDILYAAVDAPANARVVDLDNAEVRLGGRWREVTREELMPLLEESGVWRRANLPTTPRARLTTLLPILLIAIGCFALVIAGPAFFDRNERRRLVVQGLLVAVTLAGLVFALNTGFLSWPGLKAWREPAMLVLEGKLKS